MTEKPLNNRPYKRFTPLPQERTDNKEMVFGIQSVIETLRAGKEIDKLLVQRDLNLDEVQRLANEMEVPIQRVPVEKLNRVTRKNHQGVIAFVSAINYATVHNVLSGAYEKGQTPLLLLLDRITDVRNFGGIARTAECAGVQGIVVPMRGGAQINADAMKTSSGALNYLPVCRERNLSETLRYLQDSGVKVVVCTEKAEKQIYDVDLTGPTAIVMGSEEDGISTELIRYADEMVKIPMNGKIESLNVSVATGVVLYEVVRQRVQA